VLANRRHAFTLWELAARGGRAVSAVNWWSTYPAEPLPGLVVAHGAYQLLADGAKDAVASESRPDLVEWAVAGRQAFAESPPEALEKVVQAALPEGSREAVLERAVLPDRFYLQALEQSLALEPRVAALYLPAPDLAADGWSGGDIALSDLVRAHLEAVDALLTTHARDFGTVAVFVDPGRRGGVAGRQDEARGRVLLWRHDGGCGGADGPSDGAELLSPQAVTAGLSLALGLPASDELPSAPAVCTWPTPRDHVPSFGRRRPMPPPAAPDSEEYLRNLRSLGYL
jgi:hypothetical protein